MAEKVDTCIGVDDKGDRCLCRKYEGPVSGTCCEHCRHILGAHPAPTPTNAGPAPRPEPIRAFGPVGPPHITHAQGGDILGQIIQTYGGVAPEPPRLHVSENVARAEVNQNLRTRMSGDRTGSRSPVKTAVSPSARR